MATSVTAPAQAGAFRLLVVDDDLATIRQLGSLLAGYAQISFATRGEDALAIARTQRPDLVLLDAEMPGLSGFDVFKALQADPLTATVPVVFATSHTEPEVEAAALRMGAADFISKPFVASQVLARVRSQLQRRTSAAGPSAPGARRMPRLLIVDDEPAAIQAVQSLLAGVADCYFALDGSRALEMAATLQPDVLLLDIEIPLHDGFEVCRRLKDDARCGGLSVAFVTQHATAENEALAFEAGADDFIGKPYDGAVLAARVRRLVHRKHRVEADLEAVRALWRGIGDTRVAEIVAAASDAIVVADTQGRIVLSNRAAGALFGIGAGSAVGQPLTTYLAPAAGGAVAAGRQQVRRADGSRVTVEVALSGVGAGGDELHAYVLRDTTERDRREHDERRLGEAEAARRATSAMLAFIAHEMGNPLNAVLGFAELARTDTAAPLPPVQAQRLEHIAEAGRSLQALMRDVIDLNRIGAGQFRIDPEPVDAAAVVRAVCAEMAAAAASAQVTLHAELPDAPVRLATDPRRLRQCLANLVSNAIKYGGQPGRVQVVLRRDAGDLLINVCDAGPGLTEAQLAQLFEPYNRLGRDAGPLPGTGLGLLLTRELALALGGRLEVHSHAGQGSCFSLRLPERSVEA